jgi:beta-1,4-mannosyl-glycoprotein beta-1,4-N-acetylglucosaminyltransferase
MIDAFVFFNELDVLEIRMNELDPVVDWFVIVEGDMTFTGHRKEPVLLDPPDWYKKFHHKVVWYYAALDPKLDAWGREAQQRNAIANAVRCLDVRNDDTIILSDADEIPRRNVISQLSAIEYPRSLWLRKFSYRLNIETDEHHGSTKVMPYSYFRQSTPQHIRKTDIKPYVMDAGWEFSSLGSAEHIAEKFRSFSHTELDVVGISDVNSIQKRMNNLEDVAGRGYKHKLVDIDDTWPVAITENPDRWKELVWTE